MTAKEIRSVALPCGIGIALMLMLALAFRLYMRRHPDPVVHRLPVHQVAEAPVANGEEASVASEPVVPAEPPVKPPEAPEVCLVKPLAEWSAEETAAYPALRGWLAERSRKVLPWEWSDGAIAKSPDGYCAAWSELAWEQEVKVLARDITARLFAVPEGSAEPRVSLVEIGGLRLRYEREAQKYRESVPDGTPAHLRAEEPAAARVLVKAID